MRILLVDDEPLVTEMVARALSMELGDRVEVVRALHGQEALARLAEGPIDLVVSDVDMPVMNGVELHGAIRERGLSVSFAFLTGIDLEPGVLPPGVPVVSKLVELKALVASIRGFIEQGALESPAIPPQIPRRAPSPPPVTEDVAGVVAVVSQDIREQIMIVQGYHNIIESGLAPTLRTQLSAGRRALARIGVIIGEVSDWVRLIDGSYVAVLEPVDIGLALTQLLQANRAVLDDAGIGISYTAPPPGAVPAARADTRLTDRILQNLLNVVLINSPRERSVTAQSTASIQDRTVSLTLAFACPMLPRELVGELFDFGARGSLRRVGFNPGKGLGITMAARGAIAMGGRLLARMPIEGQLELILSLPAHVAVSKTPPRILAPARILILVSGPIEANLLSQALEHEAPAAGRRVIVEVVASGPKGRETILGGGISFLVADDELIGPDPAAFFARLSPAVVPGRTVVLVREGPLEIGVPNITCIRRPDSLSAIRDLAMWILKHLPVPTQR